MHPYESPSDRIRYPGDSHVPAIRQPHSAQDTSAPSAHRTFPRTATPQRTATPIYDALYSEYQRLFRALPGDRSGEEALRFERFDTVRGIGTGSWGDPPRRHARAMPAALPPAPRDGNRYGL